MSTFSIFIGLIVVICLLLMLVIMVQNPKGGGLSSSFGGGGSQVVGGVKKTGDFLDRSTWILAGFLIALILLSNITLKTQFGGATSKVLPTSESTEGGVREVGPGETTEELPSQPLSTPEEEPENN
jgi:preprotein translocase subunit SecG